MPDLTPAELCEQAEALLESVTHLESVNYELGRADALNRPHGIRVLIAQREVLRNKVMQALAALPPEQPESEAGGVT
jgi:hypothetical protein